MLSLSVTIGEAVDTLTLLDIKCFKLKDATQKAANQEKYNVLHASLKESLATCAWHYKILREINLRIWDLSPPTSETDPMCYEILKEQDRRTRVINKINYLMKSDIAVEKKIYLEKRRAFFYGHLGLGDMFWLNGAVRYLATEYDEILVVCKKKYESTVAGMYADDSSIKLYLVEDDVDIQPFYQYHRGLWASKGYTVYACGNHLINPADIPKKPWIYEFPFCFYDDLKIPRSVRTEYFFIHTYPEALAMVQVVKHFAPKYAILHQQSSTKRMNIWDTVVKQTTYPSLDLNENHYPVGHPFHIIAELVVNKPLYWHKCLIEEATEIHLLESSVYCMASQLDLSRVAVKKCYDAFDNSDKRLGIFETATL